MGQILGEGFFGEVHKGVYKSPVSRGAAAEDQNRVFILRRAAEEACVAFAERREDPRGHQNVQGRLGRREGEVPQRGR